MALQQQQCDKSMVHVGDGGMLSNWYERCARQL